MNLRAAIASAIILIAKAAMSDSLGDGRGNPTQAQIRLYERWANGGVVLSIVGEVQGNPHFAEKPGKLVLNASSDSQRFVDPTRGGSSSETQFWLQLGDAGAMAHPPISVPKGPSQLELPGLVCGEFSRDEIRDLPGSFANTAVMAKPLGFGGIEIHAAHGFLLSQFLLPIFNRRGDSYGGDISGRMRIVLQVVEEVRQVVGSDYSMAIKLNASDLLDGGLWEDEPPAVIAALEHTGIDLIDISGGTYFPGANSASDSRGDGLYFIAFAREARRRTQKPLMVTDGFKTRDQAIAAVSEDDADLIGLPRALVLDPNLPNVWLDGAGRDPEFPQFAAPPEGVSPPGTLCV